ncbi:hypothetical protein [Halorussus ruber]|uniref:hypothetical protein n=1 Tax=Halorussus ruber TaxID=1126238 RepID=UPI0010925E36|nr:hypothetical protein [Halorussus ruber]
MRRTTKLLVTVSFALLAVGFAASGVTAQEVTSDIGTACSCLDSGGGSDDGGGGNGELKRSLDSGFVLNFDAGGGDDNDDGGCCLER